MKQYQCFFVFFCFIFFVFPSQIGWCQPNSPLVTASFGDIPQPKDIKRVVSAGPVADTLLLSLIPNKMLGLSTHRLSSESKNYFPSEVKNLPLTGRVAGRDTTFPLEKIIALKPDIIIDVGSTSATYISTAQRINKLTGIPYILINGELKEAPEQLRVLGELLGVSERGNLLGDCAEKILTKAAIAKRNKIKDQHSVRIYFGGGLDGLQTGLAGSIQTESIDLVGAYNVASEAGKNLTARVSMEQLIKWNPDIIITQDESFYLRLTTDPIWQRMSAVKKGSFYLVPNKPFGWISHPPSINRLLGVIWLTRVLYPESMSYEEYKQEITDYFKLFYDYQLTSSEVAAFSKGLE